MIKKKVCCLWTAVLITSIQPSLGECVKDAKYYQICDDNFQPDWWMGSWVSHETDQCGNDLVAFIYLGHDNSFLKHLVANDHTTRTIWGSYKITVSPSQEPDGKEYVPTRDGEIKEFNIWVATAARYDHIASHFYSYSYGRQLASSGYPRTGLMNALHGVIEFTIEGKKPDDYAVGVSQTYSFKTQGIGYIQITGPGSNEELMKKYSGQMLVKNEPIWPESDSHATPKFGLEPNQCPAHSHWTVRGCRAGGM